MSLGSDFNPKRPSPLSGTFRKTIILHSVPAAVTLALAAVLWVLPPPTQQHSTYLSLLFGTFKKEKGIKLLLSQRRWAAGGQACPGEGKQLVSFPDCQVCLFSSPQAGPPSDKGSEVSQCTHRAGASVEGQSLWHYSLK